MNVNALDFGAVPNGEGLQTDCLQAAIDHCFLSGGGRVIVPTGRYLSGDLRLRSHVTLYLEKDAVICGSLDPKEYLHIFADRLEPLAEKDRTMYHWIPIDQRGGAQGYHHLDSPGSYWNYGLIRAIDAEDIAILAEEGGGFDGQNCYDPEGEGCFRGPHCINMHRCRNIRLEGYTVRNSANWAHAIFSSEALCMQRVTVLAGHDGVHIRSCDHVRIADCVFKTGDDCLAGFDNYEVSVRNCVFNSACSGLRFGGQNVLVEDCLFYGPCEYIFRCHMTKEEMEAHAESSATARKNMLGMFTYFVDPAIQLRRPPKNICIRNCTVRNADRLLHLNLSGNEWWQKGAPPEDITLENIRAEGIALGLNAYGDGTVPFRLTLRQVDYTAREGSEQLPLIRAGSFGEITLEDVTLRNATPDALILCYTEAGAVVCRNVKADIPEHCYLKVTDAPFVCDAI